MPEETRGWDKFDKILQKIAYALLAAAEKGESWGTIIDTPKHRLEVTIVAKKRR